MFDLFARLFIIDVRHRLSGRQIFDKCLEMIPKRIDVGRSFLWRCFLSIFPFSSIVMNRSDEQIDGLFTLKTKPFFGEKREDLKHRRSLDIIALHAFFRSMIPRSLCSLIRSLILRLSFFMSDRERSAHANLLECELVRPLSQNTRYDEEETPESLGLASVLQQLKPNSQMN